MARLRAVEDHLAVSQLVCAYGYGVDGRSREALGRIYSEDAVYSVSDAGAFVGREQIQAIIDLPEHVALVDAGCAHISTPPYVRLDGDRAVATCHTMVVRHGEQGFYIWRVSASRLECSRHPDGGWRIDHRRNEVLDGDPNGPALLAQMMQPQPLAHPDDGAGTPPC